MVSTSCLTRPGFVLVSTISRCRIDGVHGDVTEEPPIRFVRGCDVVNDDGGLMLVQKTLELDLAVSYLIGQQRDHDVSGRLEDVPQHVDDVRRGIENGDYRWAV